MQHRISVRVPTKINVAVSRGGLCCGRFTASNVGYGGLYLGQCSDVLEEGDFVVVSIQEDTLEHSATTPTVGMVVVHCSEGGAGLMWTECNEGFFGVLDNIMGIAAHTYNPCPSWSGDWC